MQDEDRGESKDENSKPLLTYSSSRSTTPSMVVATAVGVSGNHVGGLTVANKQGINVKLLNENKNGATKIANGFDQPQTATPILASLSTNLTNGGPKVKQSQNQLLNGSAKEVNGTAPVPAVASVSAAVATAAPVIAAAASNMSLIESLSARLSNNVQPMAGPVKLLDENLQWQDTLLEFMSDQPDFLVVGVLGKKGVGKSTLMSLLAGSKFEEQMLFKTADGFRSTGKDLPDLAQHKTNGIHAYITSERTVLLDVQVN